MVRNEYKKYTKFVNVQAIVIFYCFYDVKLDFVASTSFFFFTHKRNISNLNLGDHIYLT